MVDLEYDLELSDDDDIISYVEHLGRPRRPRIHRNRTDHFTKWDEIDFYNRFRLSKCLVNSLLNLIRADIQSRTNWNKAVTPEAKLLLTIHFLALGNMLISAGDFIGIHKTTAGKHIWTVLRAIVKLRRTYISMENDRSVIINKQKEFFAIARFPKVIGALDCTHIRIISPGGSNAETFRNRKGFYSINVQAICDANLKLSNVVARWPGSTHDSRIFQNSKIMNRFENGQFEDSVLLGDGGYALTSFCLTPIPNVLSEEDNLYNEAQIRTRNCIERAFGVWKRRFPVLSLGIRLDYKKVQYIVIATAILHNMAICNHETEPPPVSSDTQEAINLVNSVSMDIPDNTDPNNDARRPFLRYFRSLIQQ